MEVILHNENKFERRRSRDNLPLCLLCFQPAPPFTPFNCIIPAIAHVASLPLCSELGPIVPVAAVWHHDLSSLHLLCALRNSLQLYYHGASARHHYLPCFFPLFFFPYSQIEYTGSAAVAAMDVVTQGRTVVDKHWCFNDDISNLVGNL